ncbi:MAG: flippase-like domain-containing protein [Salinivirgaceae bacterium]|nr:flippase-like domain-containing protein [Salinivirgaceae bacterium]
MKKLKKSLKYIFFLAIGIFLFSKVYKEYDLTTFVSSLQNLKWGWVFLSLIFALLSHLSRAIRWNMLITPLDHNPKILNTLFSVMIMYATNLIIPRGGELARCTVLSKYEKIPFGTLVGTVVTERATDTLLLMILAFTTLFAQIGVFNQFLINNPEIGTNFGFIFTWWFWTGGFFLAISSLILLWKLRNKLKRIHFLKKIYDLLHNFFEGIKSIKNLKNPGLFIFHSIFIYIMYFLMMYVVFLSYEPTENMTLIAGLTAFIMGGLAMLAPVQGGIGAWHFMVIETLAVYGLGKEFGKDFALISHTSMNLMLLIIGGISFILIPIYNRKR